MIFPSFFLKKVRQDSKSGWCVSLISNRSPNRTWTHLIWSDGPADTHQAEQFKRLLRGSSGVGYLVSEGSSLPRGRRTDSVLIPKCISSINPFLWGMRKELERGQKTKGIPSLQKDKLGEEKKYFTLLYTWVPFLSLFD